MNDLHFQGTPDNSSFELTVIVRDASGQPTGRTKTIQTDDSHKLWEFWMRHKGRPRRKKKKRENVPNAKEADKIMTQMKDYIPKKKQNNEG